MSKPLNTSNKDWLVYVNNLNSTSNANMTFTASDGSGILRLVDGAIQIPFGLSSERPLVPNAGMIRFSTSDQALEYYNPNQNQWNFLSVPPSIDSVSPTHVSDNNPNSSLTDASVSVFGSNFGVTPPQVTFIGSNSSEFISPFTYYLTGTSPVIAEVPQALFDNSNLSPFGVKVTSATNLSDTLLNAIEVNAVPFFTSPAAGTIGTGFIRNTSAFAAWTLSAEDPENLPISFSSPDLSINTSTSMDISYTGTVFGTFPNISSSVAVQNITFTGKALDTSGGIGFRNYNFNVYAQQPYAQSGGNVLYISSISGEGDISSNPYLDGSVLITYSNPGSGYSFSPSVFDVSAEYVVIGGGGGGGASALTSGGACGGGGGAGEIQSGRFNVSTTGITINVGAGGQGENTGGPSVASNGANSVAGSITALGGGRGGTSNFAENGQDGGSGGGAAINGQVNGTIGLRIGNGYGNDGGLSGRPSAGGGGGGGGAGEIGGNGQYTTAKESIAGDGGDGIELAISGITKYYAGGGGGGCFKDGTRTGIPSIGGLGGGGNGGDPNGVSSGQDASANSGSGGGGGSYNGSVHHDGGNGGSGVVFIRFPYNIPFSLPAVNGFAVTGDANTVTSVYYVDAANQIRTSPVSNGFTIYQFRTSSPLTSSILSITPNQDLFVSYLAIGGGGGAQASFSSGGGGSGGLLTSYATISDIYGGTNGFRQGDLFMEQGQTYQVIVGGGGQGQWYDSGTVYPDGGESSQIQYAMGLVEASGGGFSAERPEAGTLAGGFSNGGFATGGAPRWGGSASQAAATGGTGNPFQGYAGGNVGTGSGANSYPGSGGGGVGGVGTSATAGGNGGDGGIGIESDITGTSYYYGGGGGGSTQNITDVTLVGSVPGNGGLGGGGKAGWGGGGSGNQARRGENGTNGLGGGGGGGSSTGQADTTEGGGGGGGTVILRIPSFIPQTAPNFLDVTAISNGFVDVYFVDSTNTPSSYPRQNGKTIYAFKCNLPPIPSAVTTADFSFNTGSASYDVSYLMVGGGGASSSSNGGGGGAGGVIIGSIDNLSGAQAISVGQGGVGYLSNGSLNNLGFDGSATIWHTIGSSAGGGGVGGVYTAGGGIAGGNGQSSVGGTGALYVYGGSGGGEGQGTAGFGSGGSASGGSVLNQAGGNGGAYTNPTTGGGGGAGGNATNLTPGDGIISTILGSSYYWGGGGGGLSFGAGTNAANGGLGGGGGGMSSNTGNAGVGGSSSYVRGGDGVKASAAIGGFGAPYTGGGGGGSGGGGNGNASAIASDGGSGIVLISIPSFF